jgi:hypothetical protein
VPGISESEPTETKPKQEYKPTTALPGTDYNALGKGPIQDDVEGDDVWYKKVQQGREEIEREKKLKELKKYENYQPEYITDEFGNKFKAMQPIAREENLTQPLQKIEQKVKYEEEAKKIQDAAPEEIKSTLKYLDLSKEKGLTNFISDANYYFNDAGFEFKDAGSGYIEITSPDGEVNQFKYHFGGKQDIENTIGSINNLILKKSAKLKDVYGLDRMYKDENKKFATQYQIDSDFSMLAKEQESLAQQASTFLKRKQEAEAALKAVNELPMDKRTADYRNDKFQAEQNLKAIYKEAEDLQKKIDDIPIKQKNLEKALGKYNSKQEKQGTWVGGIYNSMLSFLDNTLAGGTDIFIDLKTKVIPLRTQLGSEEYEKRVRTYAAELGIDANKVLLPEEYMSKLTDPEKRGAVLDAKVLRENIDAKIRDDIRKKEKYGTEDELTYMEAMRNGFRTAFGDKNTTEQWEALTKKSFVGGAVLGAAEFVPTMFVPGAWVRRATTYASVNDMVNQEIENIPELRDISEAEKLYIKIPIGLVGAVLEEYGVKNIIQNTALVKSITGRALLKATGGMTPDAFKKIVSNEVSEMIADGTLKILGGAVMEFETGAAQQGVDIAVKNIYNASKGKKLFDTPDTVVDIAVDMAVGGLQESIGSVAITTPMVVATAYRKKEIAGIPAEFFDVFVESANDRNIEKGFIATLKNDITAGKITQKEAVDLLNNYRNSVGLLRSVPPELDNADKKKAMVLLSERKELENKTEGKDPALVKPIQERITQINEQLTKLTQDAIQKQAAGEVSLQSETEPSKEMEAGGAEAGPQAAPKQGVLSPEESQRKEALIEALNVYADSEEDSNILVKLEKGVWEGVSKKDVQAELDALIQKEQATPEVQKQAPLTPEESQRKEELLAAFENPKELKGAVGDVPTVFIRVNDTYEDKADVQAELDALLQKEQATPEAPKQTTTDVFTAAPTETKQAITFMSPEGTEVALEGNEQVAAQLYDEAIATPEDQRSQQQNDIVQKMQPLVTAAAPAVEVTPTTEQKAAPVQPAETFTEQDRARKQELTDALAKADKRRKNVTVGETVMPKADVKAELDALNQKEQAAIDAEVQAIEQLFSAPKETNTDKIKQAVTNAVKAIAKILPKTKIVIHETNDAFEKATGRKSKDSGLYVPSADGGTIHINMSTANTRTVGHEVFHAILLRGIKTDAEAQRLAKAMIEAVAKSLNQSGTNQELLNELERFLSRYDENIQNEEYLAEVFGYLADGYPQLTAPQKSIINRFIDRIIKMFGLKPMTDKGIIDFMNTLSRKVATGEEISESDIEIINKVDNGTLYENEYVHTNGTVINTPSERRRVIDLNDTVINKSDIIDVKELQGKPLEVVYYDNFTSSPYELKNRVSGSVLNKKGEGGPAYSYRPEIKKAGIIAAFTNVTKSLNLIQGIRARNATAKQPAVIGVALQNKETGHLGNLTTSRDFYSPTEGVIAQAINDGIISEQDAVKMLKDAVNAYESTKYGKDIKTSLKFTANDFNTLEEFYKNISGISFERRGTFNNNVIPSKSDLKISKSTRPYVSTWINAGIPTLKDYYDATTEQYTKEAEPHDIVKYLSPNLDKVGISSSVEVSDAEIKRAKEMGVEIVKVEDSLAHTSYPVVLFGDNVGIPNFFNSVRKMAKDWNVPNPFFKAGRRSEKVQPVIIPSQEVTEKLPSARQQKSNPTVNQTTEAKEVGPLDNVEATTKALDEKKEQLKNVKKIIDNANNIKLADKSKFENYGKQESENTDIGRSDSNGAEGRAKRGGQGDVGKETPISSMVYGVALTREEFDRNYENYDPRELLRSGKISGFHAGITDVNSFEGYTPNDWTQQFGYILGESPISASSFAFQTSRGKKPQFVYETEITNGDFLSHNNPPTKEQLKKIGIVNGVDFTNWNGEGSVFDAIAKTFFGDWDDVDWRNENEYYKRYHDGKIAAAKLLKEKGFVGNKYEAIGDLNAQYEVYEASDLKIKEKYQLYNTDTELISDQYHKAKADGSNPELVQAVEEVLGKGISPRQQKSNNSQEIIKQARANGYSEESIKAYFKKNGFSDIEIDMLFDEEKGGGKKPELSEKTFPGYTKLMNRINDIIERGRRNGKSYYDIMKGVIANVESRSPEYANATAQKQEQIIRDIRKMFGEKEKAAPSAAKILGKPKLDETNLPGYNEMMDKVDAMIARQTKRGTAVDKMAKNLDALLRKFDAYINATDAQKKALEQEARNRIGAAQKRAPSTGRILGAFKDITNLGRKEKSTILNNIMRLAKDAANDLANEIKAMKVNGKITISQFTAIQKRLSKVNFSNEVSISSFVDYMAKVFKDAEYADKLNKANDLQSTAKSLSKNKDKNPEVRELAKKFAKIDPSLVENIDEYIEMASAVVEGLKGSKLTAKGVSLAAAVDINETSKYVEKALDYQAEKQKQMMADKMQSLMGIDVSDLTYDQLLELLDDSSKPIDKYKETIIRDIINKMFDTYSSIIESMLETGKDPFDISEDAETIEFKDSTKQVVRNFMSIDLNSLSPREAIKAVDALNNFIVNGSTANMETVYNTYLANKNASAVKKKGVKGKKLTFFFVPSLGRMLMDEFASLPLLLESMFKSTDVALYFSRMSGLSNLMNGAARATTITQKTISRYLDTFSKLKPNGKAFNDAYNATERGMVAFMSRNIIGSEAKMKKEFNDRKSLVEKSIEELSNGTAKEQEKAKLYQEAYDKILDGSENAQQVKDKAAKENVEAVDWWINEWSKHIDELSDVSLNVYNKILERELNYTTDRYSKLELSQKDESALDSNASAYHFNNGTMYKKEAGALKETTDKTGELPKNKDGEVTRYVDLSFDSIQASSLYDAMSDIKTAGAIRQVEAFFKSKDTRSLFSAEDFKLLNDRVVNLAIRNIRNQQSYDNGEIEKLVKALDKFAKYSASIALAGVTQPFKQTVPLMFNTLINAGQFDPFGVTFNSDIKNFIDESGRAIANRGVESQVYIESINRLIDEAAKSTPEAALKLIERANDLWMKVFLANPDRYIARASWMAYYEQSLKKQGKFPKGGIDYSNHEINDEAADYAQIMVDRQQAITDTRLAGRMYSDTKGGWGKKVLTRMLLPLASFRLNQFIRAKSDTATFFSKTTTLQDKIKAGRSLTAMAAEMLVFKTMVIGFGLTWHYISDAILAAITGDDEDEKEKEEKWKVRFNNLVKGQATGAVTDLFSPIPILDPFVKLGANTALDVTQNFLKVAEDDKFKLFVDDPKKLKTYSDAAGMYGIGIDKIYEIFKTSKLAITGKFIDDQGHERFIRDEQKPLLSWSLIPSFIFNAGLLPGAPEFNNVMGKITKDIKYSAMTAKQMDVYKKTGLDKDELKRSKEKALKGYSSEEQFEENDPKGYAKAIENGTIYDYRKQNEEIRIATGEITPEQLYKVNPKLWQEKYGPGTDYYKKQRTPAAREKARKEERYKSEIKAKTKVIEAKKKREEVMKKRGY